MSVRPSHPANRPRPPKRAIDLGARSQHQVVGVAEDDLHAESLVVVGAEVLDRPAGAHRHEARGRVGAPCAVVAVPAAPRRRSPVAVNATGCTALDANDGTATLRAAATDADRGVLSAAHRARRRTPALG